MAVCIVLLSGCGGTATLSPGVPERASIQGSAVNSAWTYYQIEVPAGTKNLVVDVFDLPGAKPNDVDLYLRFNANPDLANNACKSQVDGAAAEHCSIANPTAGHWFAGVTNWDVGEIAYAIEANVAEGAALGVKPDLSRIGTKITLTGSGITPGTRLMLSLPTPSGSINLVPTGLAPTATTSTTWSGNLPTTWPIVPPGATSLGQGYAAATLVRTDQGNDVSNVQGIVLAGSTAAGVPTITKLGGVPLAVTSWDERYQVANVESLVEPGKPLTIDGDGFGTTANTRVNLFHATGNCGPLTPTAATAASITVSVPAKGCVTGPGAVQVLNTTSGRTSPAISVPLGALLDLTSVTRSGNVVDLEGTGFSVVTVVNLYASVNGSLVNVGGIGPDGSPKIAISLVSATELRFTRPAGVDPGPASVALINPPYLPYTTSGELQFKFD